MTGRRRLYEPDPDRPRGGAPPNPRPIPTCLPARLCSLPGVPRDKLAYTPLPSKERSPRSLLRQFCAAPQFAGIDPKTLLSQRRGGLGVILLTQDDYCARQAAMYLTALLLGMVKKAQPAEPELPDALAWLEENEGPDLKRAMLVASPSLLDPTLGNESRWDREIPVKLDAASALLVTAPDGPVLSRRLIETLPAPRIRGWRRTLTVSLWPCIPSRWTGSWWRSCAFPTDTRSAGWACQIRTTGSAA